MKLVGVSLQPLKPKHYETQIELRVEDDNGRKYFLGVSVYGHYPYPSRRAIEEGWEEGDGMDHVESEAEYAIASIIYRRLSALVEKEQW